jgi:MFS family permease
MTAFSDYYFYSRAHFQIPYPTPSMTRPSSPTFDAPYLLELRSSKSFILLTVCAAIFTDSFLYGVLIPVIPFTLHHRSGIPESDVQWWTSVILAGYGLMVLIGSPISGYYADHSTNRRKPFFLGLLSLSVGTVLFGVATNIYVLVVSRMLQGLSAAVVYSVGLAVLTDTVDREEIGAWMGTALSSNSVGLVVSPILGGLVYRTLGYGAVFAMASTMIVIDIVLRVLMVERKTAEQFRCSEVQSIQVGETEAYGTFPSPQTHETHAIEDPKARSETPSVVTTSSTSANHQTTALPALLILLSSRRLLASLYGSLVNFTILVSFDATLPLFVFRTFNWSSLGAGLVFLALTIPALAGPLVGRLSDKFGPRWIVVAGCILTAPGLVSLRFVDHDSTKQIVLFCFLLTLIGRRPLSF